MPNRPRLALIAAVARNRVIGRGGELVWRESADQQHFRRVTLGCPVIMGRKTWDSLPARFRPLPGRRNIVVTRNAGWHGEGAERAGGHDPTRERGQLFGRKPLRKGLERGHQACRNAETN